MASKAKYRFTGTYPDVLASGQPVEPGEFVHLSEEEAEENHVLLAEGRLVGTGSASKEQEEKAERKQAQKEKQEREEES